MSDNGTPAAANSSHGTLSMEARDRLERVLERFADAWRRGEWPPLEEYLAEVEPAEQGLLLRELVRAELQRRLQGGEPVRVEDYLDRFPELREPAEAVLGLISAEFASRQPREPDLTCGEYLRRFPQYREELLAHLPFNPETLPGEVPAVEDARKRANAKTEPLTERYEVEARLGQGGMGTVYRARDRLLGRTVALKVIRPEAMTAAVRTRFLTEARAVAKLDHPHIIKVFDVGEMPSPDGGVLAPYLTLEFVSGGSLGKYLANQLNRNQLDPKMAARLLLLLARAMQHAHDRGIVHRDLKPDNVLLAEPAPLAVLNMELGCPKIADFGVAREMQSERRLTQTGTLLGTPAYMAPEQVEGLPEVGAPSDVYALGVILYRLLTGKVPFDAPTMVDLLHKVCHDPPTPLRQVCPEVPEELEHICLACLDKDPGRRPAAADLAGQLERFLAGDRATLTLPHQAIPQPGRQGELPARQGDSSHRFVVLCDLAGSQAILEQAIRHGGGLRHGAAEMVAEIHGYFDAARAHVPGGDEIDRAGDGVLILFENAFSAVGYVEKLHQLTRERDSRIARELREDPTQATEEGRHFFRAGIAYGAVHLTTVNGVRRAVGAVVADASRYQGEACAGECLIDCPTFAALQQSPESNPFANSRRESFRDKHGNRYKGHRLAFRPHSEQKARRRRARRQFWSRLSRVVLFPLGGLLLFLVGVFLGRFLMSTGPGPIQPVLNREGDLLQLVAPLDVLAWPDHDQTRDPVASLELIDPTSKEAKKEFRPGEQMAIRIAAQQDIEYELVYVSSTGTCSLMLDGKAGTLEKGTSEIVGKKDAEPFTIAGPPGTDRIVLLAYPGKPLPGRGLFRPVVVNVTGQPDRVLYPSFHMQKDGTGLEPAPGKLIKATATLTTVPPGK